MFKPSEIRLHILNFILIMLTVSMPLLLTVPLTEVSLWFLSVGVYFLTGCVGLTMTLHRGISHRSFEFNSRIAEKVCTYLGAVNCTGSSISFALIHSLHHEYADTEKDPHHNGAVFGKIKEKLPVKILKLYKDILRDKFHMFIHDNYFLIIAVHAMVILTLFGPIGFYFGFVIPATFAIAVSIATNLLAHGPIGYQLYNSTDGSKNIPFMALPTWGESWHNTHHAEPWDWNFSRAWYEVDITALVIRLLFVTKLAKPGIKW